MTSAADVEVHVGRHLERVLRTVAWLVVVSAIAVPLSAQLLAVDDGVPAAARWMVTVVLCVLATWVLRTPLTDPATAVRNRQRLEAFPWSIAVAAAALQLIDATPVIGMLLLLAGSVAATFMRPRPLVALGGFIAVVQLLATARATTPDWLLTLGILLVLTLALWAIHTMAAAQRDATRLQLEALERERTQTLQLARVIDASESLHTTETGIVLRTITEVATELGWDRAALHVEGGTEVLASRVGYANVAADQPHALGVTHRSHQSGTTVVMDDYPNHPDSDPAHHDLNTVVAVPVSVAGETRGALSVGRRAGDATPSEVHLLELLGRHASFALELAIQFHAQEQAHEALQQLTALKDDFLATVSHELRTPLHVVLGMAETLDHHWDALATEDRHLLVTRMHRNAGALDAVITSLLDFARLESGRMELKRAEVDVAALVATVVERALDANPDHTLLVTLPDGPEPATAMGDGALLERVIDNLVTNAIRHTPIGTRVTTSVTVDDGIVEVSVSDDGPGIDPADAPHLTERFYRGGNPLQRVSRGVGLGLPLCAEILSLHHSELIVLETPGGGATFRFPLPRTEAAASLEAAR